jgi:MoCo/4Fe-4S cofactor protein with predicted Tat translocation signal
MRDRILAEQNGKQYWRSLEELADSQEFREFVEREYPQHAEEWNDPFSRRTFIKLMGASLALAGLTSCVYQPPEKIVPYVDQPEDIVPGKPLFFATAMQTGGVATPLLVKSNEGRPTKIEGNPDHPNNRNADLNDKGTSATDIFAQASILTLYDPDRSQTLTYREEIRPWTAFVADINRALEEQRRTQGAGLRILTETVTSPTLANQLKTILTEFPAAKWHQYEPAGRDGARAAAAAAFGEPVNIVYRFDQAERILSIDSDFLACGPGNLRHARDFAAKRRVTDERKEMNRLYAIESTPTNTGAMADHKLSVRPSEMEGFTRAVASALNGAGVTVRMDAGGANSYTAHANWINALARDLQQHAGRSIVIVGDEQPASIHALAHAMNEALGNVGKTIIYTEPIEARPEDHTQSLRDLINDIDGGRVQMLVILGGNPVYTTPADLKLDQARMNKVALRAHLSLYKDETSELCHWHVPEAHYLESWSDARSYDGTVSIIQPLIAPLYNGKTAHELLAVFSNEFDRRGYEIVREFWQGQMGGGGQQNQAAATNQTMGGNQSAAAGNQALNFANRPILTAPVTNATTDFEMAWRKALHDGFIPNTAARPREGLSVRAPGQPAAPTAPASGFEIVFRTDPSIYDGRFANNGWLQELPKPQNKLTWDNAALISPATAKQLGITNKIGTHGGDVHVDTVTIEYAGRSVTAPTWITPGQPDNVVTVHLGYGRTQAGRVGTGKGFNAYAIRTADSPWFGSGVRVTKTGEQFSLAVTQLHHLMENRDPVRVQTLEKHLEDQDHPKEKSEGHGEAHGESSYNDSMYPQYDYKNRDYAWGMAIDVSSCVGCNACVVACQSENNIPIVGKEQVQRSREMHWIRVDSYFGGQDENNPEGPYFQPVPCMHCEQAPCEPVCPVHATVHSAEGLNDMVYNRCVGTRYCANNCPYKVRRFNFLLYQDWTTPTYQLMRNPEVTIRSRGVMEKCTYCVQRIQWGKIEAEKEGRVMSDGEVVTACQAVCPTEAIVFGNINDPEARVSKLKAEQRNYSLLSDLNTQPRTTYLSALKNPNKEIAEKA